MVFPPFFVYSIGMILGIILCAIYGKCGGDEGIIYQHPKLKALLKVFHHWMFGICIIFMLFMLSFYYSIGAVFSTLLFGFGTGVTVDDVLFHSFESYFSRKE